MNVKGSLLKSLPIFVKSNFGARAYERFLNALQPESRQIYERPIRLSYWYPARAGLIEPTGVACSLFYKGDEMGAFEIGRFSADFTLKGIYRPMVRVGTVDWLIRRSSRVITLVYDGAKSHPVKNGPRDYSYFVTQKDDHHILLERRHQGWLHRALEISRNKPGSIELAQSQARGDEVTEFHCTWD